MKRRRLELPRHNCHYPLKVARLPIPPPLQVYCHQLSNQDKTWCCFQKKWAENGTRTRDPNLGKVVLYQLSYFRSFSYYLGAFLWMRVQRYYFFLNYQTFLRFFWKKMCILPFLVSKTHILSLILPIFKLIRQKNRENGNYTNPSYCDNLRSWNLLEFPIFHLNVRFLLMDEWFH